MQFFSTEKDFQKLQNHTRAITTALKLLWRFWNGTSATVHLWKLLQSNFNCPKTALVQFFQPWKRLSEAAKPHQGNNKLLWCNLPAARGSGAALRHEQLSWNDLVQCRKVFFFLIIINFVYLFLISHGTSAAYHNLAARLLLQLFGRHSARTQNPAHKVELVKTTIEND